MKAIFAGLLAALLSGIPLRTANAEMQTWEGWGAFGLLGEPQPQVSMPSCDAVDIIAENAIGFIWHRLSPRAREATRIGWEWRVDAGPQPTFLGEPGQDRPLSVHILFEPPGEAKISAWRLQMFGFPEEAYVLTYVWGGANAPGSVVVNPYHERGRLIVLRNGFEEYAGWQQERVDLQADFQEFFVKPAQTPAWLVISTDVDDSDATAIAAIRGLFFENAAGERFTPCAG